MSGMAKIDLQKSLQMKALFTVSTGFFMVCLDTTVVNVALQNLRLSLHTDISGLQWIIDAYILSFASLLLSAGDISDRIGPKKVFCFGLLIFVIASALCGIAPTIILLIIARVLQGIGSALLVSTSLSLLRHVFLETSDRAKAFGIWGSIGGSAVAVGPVIGGFLISAFGWRSVFIINIPFGVLGLYMAIKYLPNVICIAKKIKVFQQSASIAILGIIAYIFITAGSYGWNSWTIVFSSGLLVVFIIGFLIAELLSDSPMLPKEIITQSSFLAAATIGLIINFGFYGQLFIMSLYFEQAKGYSVIETGFAFLPQAIACSMAAFFCGRFTAKVGPRLPMTIGFTISFLGLVGMTLINPSSSYIYTLAPMLLMGFGMSFIAPATIAAAMSTASPAQGGVISGIINAVRQSGSLMGIAILGSLIGSQNFIAAGMHTGFIITAILYLIGLGCTVFWILPKKSYA